MIVAALALVACFVKLYRWCCGNKKNQAQQSQSIEAFAYEEAVVHHEQ